MALSVTPTDEMKTLTVGEKIYEIVDDQAREDISEVKADLSQKANVDGAYSDLTAGNAEQLVSTIYEEDSVPYIFRTAGGSMDIGDREEDMLVGGTVAWNQLASTYSKSGNGSTAFTAGTTVTAGHKMLLSFRRDANTANSFVGIYTRANGTNSYISLSLTADGALSGATIRNVAVGGVSNGSTSNADGNVWIYQESTATVTDLMLIDLTQMFGSTIADYIYSLEQATPGAGVAWFRKLFPADYYPYDVGTLKSVESVSSHDMVGFNQWDEEWELGRYNTVTGETLSDDTRIRCKNPIRVVGGMDYYINKPITVLYYNANDGYIASRYLEYATRFTVPSDAAYVRFYLTQAYGTTYNHDVCLNIHWDGERDGEYEPYVKHSYPLDSSLTLRGIPKLDSANNLYYDGDTYESDGTVTRRYGIVDLGTLSWAYNSTTEQFRAGISPAPAEGFGSIAFNAICTKYPIVPYNSLTDKTASVFYASVKGINIKDTSYTDAATFKAAMSGVMLVYKLDAPTTETAEPYQNPQIVDDFGTEEYVTTSIVPVGHVTKYQPNLRAKLEMSPDSPDGDGDYIVRQANGENSYVSLASTATIQDILARLTALEGNTT